MAGAAVVAVTPPSPAPTAPLVYRNHQVLRKYQDLKAQKERNLWASWIDGLERGLWATDGET